MLTSGDPDLEISGVGRGGGAGGGHLDPQIRVWGEGCGAETGALMFSLPYYYL